MRCCSLNSEHIYLVAILINIVLDFVCAICQVLVAKSLVSG
ncbi:BnaC06g11280D [Brassica napus]|uniref:BnaC06g11280D protein n=2 Tax=Brassica TaxID=3705 RepID=A0A078GN85_BRANA|nr:BnaC06g11280D [Brassica napus]